MEESNLLIRKALHVKKFLTIEEQIRFLEESLNIWKASEKIDVSEPSTKYTEGFFFDIERKGASIQSLQPLVTKLNNKNLHDALPGFDAFKPRHLVGHIYGIDGSLKMHVDNVKGWAVVVSIGCTALFQVAEEKSKPIVIELKSGDAFIFACDAISNIQHGIEKVLDGTCPPELHQYAEHLRYGFVLRDHLASEVATLIEARMQNGAGRNFERMEPQKIWDVSDPGKRKVLYETFPNLPAELSQVVTRNLDLPSLSKFSQLNKNTNQFVHSSYDLWRNIYKSKFNDQKEFKLGSSYERMLHSTVKKSKSTADSDVAVIIEFGSHTLKCGIAGDDNPSLLTSSFIKKHHGQYYGGNEISQIDQGEVMRSTQARKVVNVSALEMVWEYGMTSMDKPHNGCCLVLMSDKDRATREKVCQIGFEQWDTPAFYMSDPGVTAIYAAGVTSATLIDVGYDTVSIGVVYEGYGLFDVSREATVGGRHVDEELSSLLQRDYPDLFPLIDVEAFKRKYCRVRGMTETVNPDKTIEISVKGKTFSVKESLLTDPCEVLFHPEKFQLDSLSLAQHVKASIDAVTAMDYQLIELTNKLVLAGGSTFLPGFVARLEQELRHIYPKGRFTVTAAPNRDVSAWIGGSILGSLSTFPSMWISKNEYDESGPQIVARKCF